MALLPTTPFRRDEISQLGITPATFRSWQETGLVRRVFRNVYVSADLPDSLALRAACAARVLPNHTVIVEHTAAWIHGVDLHAPQDRFGIPDLEVVSLRGHSATRRPGIYAGNRDLQSTDIMEFEGVRLTTPLRTAMDLACLDGMLPALTALDSFMRVHKITREQFAGELPRFRRRRGVVQLRRLVPLATPLSESPGESWLRGSLIRDGFPPPEPQIEFWENGRVVARGDMGYRRLKILAEYFGDEDHGPEQEEHDQARIKWLNERGWFVRVVRKEDLRGARWQQVCSDLSTAIAERSCPRTKRRYPRGQRLER